MFPVFPVFFVFPAFSVFPVFSVFPAFSAFMNLSGAAPQRRMPCVLTTLGVTMPRSIARVVLVAIMILFLAPVALLLTGCAQSWPLAAHDGSARARACEVEATRAARAARMGGPDASLWFNALAGKAFDECMARK